MKKLLLLLFFISTTCFSQDIEYKVYSYSEFFNLIANEKDSVFRLSNALIKIDYQTDSISAIRNESYEMRNVPFRKDTLVIDIPIYLDNVHFENPIFRRSGEVGFGYLSLIHFKEKVEVRNTAAFNVSNCRFDKPFKISGSGFVCSELVTVENRYNIKDRISFEDSYFKEGFVLFFNCNFQDEIVKTIVSLGKNTFHPNPETKETISINGNQFGMFDLYLNNFKENALASISSTTGDFGLFENDFNTNVVALEWNSSEAELFLVRNIFNNHVFISSPKSTTSTIDLAQFSKGIIPLDAYTAYLWFEIQNEGTNKKFTPEDYYLNDSLINEFLTKQVIENEEYYNFHMGGLGAFFDFFKKGYNNKAANQFYLQLKDLETERLKYEYQKNRTFDSFFKYQINKFLKVFSDYGTNPAKAVTFSLYVILFFALIYLFFPNSWDKHGKNRIMNRYRFFTKYMNQDAGMHDVYLEEQQKELLEAEDFKVYMQNAEKYIPGFFIATAMPLYKWAVSGTRLSASLLKHVDIMKGTWQDLPPHQRFWKSVLLIGAFITAVLYDLLIKILNAIMLSINTFTTLGFGEIPIKGLPRYLAIIQGFIGWFMLTIFSVSLISQLLN
ncbi:ion channel [Algoriphagus namhaensis]|uniref:Ion channel n=1 Tax=Algoriphagus namhaensis TaxID=915353 RepID=A0ABV8AQ77_9BACT